MKFRLIVMNFLQFAVWGAYLTSMGTYLGSVGMGANIGWFYSVQGIVSIFMPALMGIVADRWIPAQKLLSICHFIAAVCMIIVGYMGASGHVDFVSLFPYYTISVAFYMPTLALSNSVAYTALDKAGLDTVKDFPPIRVFGTIGFIASMWIVDLCSLIKTPYQFYVSAAWGILLCVYALTLPACPTGQNQEATSLVKALGLDAFKLFAEKKMAIFFIFSMLLGVSLQITNGFAGPFINHFKVIPEFADSFAANHSGILISLSQISETLCILLIPFFLKRYGIKTVMLISMFAWVGRFGFFGLGDAGFPGVLFFILSMIVYGVAFDFFNISGSLFVDKETSTDIRSSAQGLFMLMTNGLGATIGTLSAQAVVNAFTYSEEHGGEFYTMGDWNIVWFIFAAYAAVVGIAFWILFDYKHVPEPKE